ncbi:MAG: RNA-binding protein [Acidobacteria bacterium]|nr:RNA-binding protein [Acidobacteriota bacterium]
MSKKIYVGNLSYQTTENDLTNLFEQVGQVESVSIITDRDTGRSKGFAFVEMDAEGAEKAIAQFNGTEVNGRTLTVNEARPREERSGGGGGGRGGYGGGRGGSGGGGGRGGYGGSRY